MTHSRRLFASIAVLGLSALATGSVALCPSPAMADNVGYVRLAHLSPDTPAVDVYLGGVAGGAAKKFPAVAYGTVSGYMPVPVGTYSVAMRNVGAADTTTPVLSAQVTVQSGAAYTVAGVGKNADLGLRVIDDDLGLPGPGKAKVRVIQASVRVPLLDVSATNGNAIANGVAFASTTAYREVDPGDWKLKLQASGSSNATEVTARCAAGGVYSVLVLDGKSGGLTVEVRVDAKAGSVVPLGGVDTGAGGLAPRPSHGRLYGGVLLAAGFAALALAGIWMARRPRRQRPAHGTST
jgi:hypothetical protein